LLLAGDYSLDTQPIVAWAVWFDDDHSRYVAEPITTNVDDGGAAPVRARAWVEAVAD
jgi:hypothetical protein